MSVCVSLALLDSSFTLDPAVFDPPPPGGAGSAVGLSPLVPVLELGWGHSTQARPERGGLRGPSALGGSTGAGVKTKEEGGTAMAPTRRTAAGTGGPLSSPGGAWVGEGGYPDWGR